MRECHFATANVRRTNEAVAETLRYGRIDSKPSAFDKERSMLSVHSEFASQPKFTLDFTESGSRGASCFAR